ncbi:MAG: MCE family protein [Solirubrobacterales bacterium]|nr:MCE family protein [Solirubrobacterales bacterium]
MRRVAVIATLLIALGLLIAWPAIGDDGSSGDYKVRGIFDSASFLVKGEEVRAAGAKVGTVESVDVSLPGEAVTRDGRPDPGKAVVVMSITDPGFRDFREDASCIVRPQSLIGERFLDCEPTQPRAPGSEPPPELAEIPDGDAGAGQHLLPLENNGKAVDLDLINNILRVPYRDRFRLILNELGAGLAGRGKDLEEIVKRANPALRETDRVLKILAGQNRQLATLATDSDQVLAPLARDRASIGGFIANANTTAQATAERRGDLERQFELFPGALRELNTTMVKLQSFTDEAQPVFADLGAAAPDLATATQKLVPFARAGTPALTSLGDAAQAAGPKLVAADPLVVDLRDLGEQTTPVAKNLKRLLNTFELTGGYENLLTTIRNAGTASSAYDSFGHFVRVNPLISNCINWAISALSGCVANFTGTFAEKTSAGAAALADSLTGGVGQGGVNPAEAPGGDVTTTPEDVGTVPDLNSEPTPPDAADPGQPEAAPDTAAGTSTEALKKSRKKKRQGARPMNMETTRALLSFLLGNGS